LILLIYKVLFICWKVLPLAIGGVRWGKKTAPYAYPPQPSLWTGREWILLIYKVLYNYWKVLSLVIGEL
jgi:hypothetical protein